MNRLRNIDEAPKGSNCASIVRFDSSYSYTRLQQDVAVLTSRYPAIHKEEIGQSVLGKPLIALRLGSGPFAVHVNSAFHANEWLTSLLLMRFIEELAQAQAQAQATPFFLEKAITSCEEAAISNEEAAISHEEANRWLQACSLWAVPMVNPDGVDLVVEGLLPSHPCYAELLRLNEGQDQYAQWKANIRGIDLNDQFPAFWEEEVARRGHEKPGSRDFPGYAPLSEPEAQAMAQFTQRKSFEWVIALHTQGEEIYWNYRELEPPEAGELAYRLGEASGYAPVKLTGSDAGYKDWFIQTYRKPGFTVEAGLGENPLPLDEAVRAYPAVRSLIVEALRWQTAQQP